MGACPYGACEECQLFSTAPSECHFWSPLKKTCIMSSRYEQDEMEDLYLDHRKRARKLTSGYSNSTMEEFNRQIEEMKSLKKGWLDGDGEPISREAIDLVVDEVKKRMPDHPPHVFPMESGGLSLEWFLKDELCATVNPSLKGTVFGLAKSEADFLYREEDWTMEASWTRLEKMVMDIA